MTVIYVLLAAHFVADFMCQSDWMALNKSKRWDALAVHVVVYSSALVGVISTVNAVRAYRGDVGGPDVSFLLFVGVNAGAHFVQDAITSRINSRLWFIDGARMKRQARVNMTAFVNAIGEISIDEALNAVERELAEDGCEVVYNNKRHWFFVAIGFDQLLHYVTLFVTAGWWLR